MLSNATKTAADGGSWTFGSLGVTNAKAKTYGNRNDYVKYSASVQYTITGIPAGEIIKSVKFEGFPNNFGYNTYLSEFNGTSYASYDLSPAQFNTLKESKDDNDIPTTYTFTGLDIATGSVTFTVGGSQTDFIITLTTETSTIFRFTADEIEVNIADEEANEKLPQLINTTGKEVTYSISGYTVATLFNNTVRVRDVMNGQDQCAVVTAKTADGAYTASYKLYVRGSNAAWEKNETNNSYTLTGGGKLKSSDKTVVLDGISMTYGKIGDENVVVVNHPQLGFAAKCLDGNGFSFSNSVGGRDDSEPSMGTIYKFETSKAGTLNINGFFSKGNVFLWVDGTRQVPTVNSDTYAMSFDFQAGKTYYLYLRPSAYQTLYLHAFNYVTQEMKDGVTWDFTSGFGTGSLYSNGQQWNYETLMNISNSPK